MSSSSLQAVVDVTVPFWDLVSVSDVSDIDVFLSSSEFLKFREVVRGQHRLSIVTKSIIGSLSNDFLGLPDVLVFDDVKQLFHTVHEIIRNVCSASKDFDSLYTNLIIEQCLKTIDKASNMQALNESCRSMCL